MKNFYLLLLAFISFGAINAQKSIVILGSSTAAGTGAFPYDSSWAGKLQLYYRQNTTAGDPDTVVTNLALGGQWTFSVMPSWYVPPAGYPAVNTARNITQAISLNPDVIIVNLPSNDAIWPFPNWMSMNNFRTIFQEAVTYNKRIFITTSQPINNSNLNIRDSLRKIKDSIMLNFGSFAIDFWTPLASPAGDSTIRADLNSDGTHVNNLGHRLLFQQVIAEELFPASGPLPLKLLSFNATAANNTAILKWTTTEEEPDTKFEIQRSANGRDFSTTASLDASGNTGTNQYSWIDQHPFDGKTYYRLKITEPSKTSYSKIVVVGDRTNPFDISLVYTDGNSLRIKINNIGNNALETSLISLSGAVVKKQKITISNGGEVTIPITDIAPGEYIVRITDTKGNVATQRFIKLK